MKICPSAAELSDYAEKRICSEVGCGKEFATLPNLQLHLVKHHKIGKLGDPKVTPDAQFHCPVTDCIYNLENGTGKHFSQRRLLKQHYAKVHAPKNWSCVKCGWCSAIRSAVRRHTANCKHTASYPVMFQDKADSSNIKASLSGNPIKIDLVDKLSYRQPTQIDNILQEHNYMSKFVSVISSQGDISFVKIGDCHNSKHNADKNSKSEPLKQSDRFTQTLAKTSIRSDTSVKSNVETQTIENYTPEIYNDQNTISTKNFNNINFSSSDISQDIETQTALDELLYSSAKQTDYQDNDIFSDFTLLSDIQTQTSWPSRRDSTLISTETQTCNEFFTWFDDKYDFKESKEQPMDEVTPCFKETQTCDCFLSLELQNKDSTTSVGNNNSLLRQLCSLASIETQTPSSNFDPVSSKFLSRKCDVMLSCSSIETQTCDNLLLDMLI